MFGGICYMVNDKMCMGVVKDEMMCRIDPARAPEALEKNGVRPMDFTGKTMEGYLFVGEDALKTNSELRYWIDLCLEFNERAKASPKKKKKIAE